MNRLRASWLLSLPLVASVLWSGFAVAAPAREARGTPQRLTRAAEIRGARNGTIPSKTEDASQAEVEKLDDIVGFASNGRAYASVRRSLFLADGARRGWQPLAEYVARAFPEQNVLKGDIEFRGTQRAGNLVALHIDNTQKLPLPDNSVDLVVMRRGMCLCEGSTLCGGMRPTVPAVRRFMKDVYRVLDKSNPDAVAYLHGEYGTLGRVLAFRRAADQLQAQNPQLHVEMVNGSYGFAAVKISHRAN